MRNILALLSGDAVSRGLGFLVSVYLARVLAPESFGMISVGLSVLAYLTLLNGPGIQLVETRNAAASADGLQERVGAVLSMRLLLTVPLLAASAIVMLLIGTPPASQSAIMVFGASLVPLALSLEWLFQGKEDFPSITYSRSAMMVVYAALCAVWVSSPGDFVRTGVAFLAGNIAGSVWLLATYVRRYGMPGLAWDPPAWRSIFSQNAPVGAAAFLAQSSINLPPIVTALFLGNAATGVYSAAMKFVLIGLIGDRLVGALFLPVVSRYAATRADEVPNLLSVGIRAVGVAVLAAIFMAFWLAGPGIALVFGDGYSDAVPVFRILAGYVGLTIMNSLLVCTLVAFHGTNDYSRIVSTGALVFAGCAFLLTPAAGLAGTAWSVVIGETVDLVLLARAVNARVALPRPGELMRLLPALSVAVAVALATGALPDLARAVVVPAVFLAVLWMTGGFPLAELRFLREKIV
jgi:O-antigen/teichoic acid export membrane protein